MPVQQLLEGFTLVASNQWGPFPLAVAYSIDFFTNDITPTKDTVYTDFTWLTLPAWARTKLADTNPTDVVPNSDGSVTVTGGYILVIIAPYITTPINVYGWALIETTNTLGVLAERYTTPLALPPAGGVIYAPVTGIWGHYAP